MNKELTDKLNNYEKELDKFLNNCHEDDFYIAGNPDKTLRILDEAKVITNIFLSALSVIKENKK